MFQYKNNLITVSQSENTKTSKFICQNVDLLYSQNVMSKTQSNKLSSNTKINKTKERKTNKKKTKQNKIDMLNKSVCL